MRTSTRSRRSWGRRSSKSKAKGSTIFEALFTAAGHDDLAEALRTEFAEIAATTAAVSAESAEEEVDDDAPDDDQEDETAED